MSNTPRSGSGGRLWKRTSALTRPGGVGSGQAGCVQHRPEPAPSKDGGSQFTSQEFTQVLQERGVKISMDGKGRYTDNIFLERLWRTVKYDGEVRRSVPESLRRRQGGPVGTGRLLQVIQRPEAPSGLGIPDSGRGVPRNHARSHECSGGPVEGKEVFTGTGVGIMGRSDGTLT